MDIEVEGRKYVARDESELIIKLAEHIGDEFLSILKEEVVNDGRRHNILSRTKIQEQDARQYYLSIKKMRAWDELQEFGSANIFGRVVKRISDFERLNPVEVKS